jgi:hypothetical protein
MPSDADCLTTLVSKVERTDKGRLSINQAPRDTPLGMLRPVG